MKIIAKKSKGNKPQTNAERQRNKRLRDAQKREKLGGKQKRINLFGATVKQLEQIKLDGNYNCETEIITDSIAVATMILIKDKKLFEELLKEARDNFKALID